MLQACDRLLFLRQVYVDNCYLYYIKFFLKVNNYLKNGVIPQLLVDNHPCHACPVASRRWSIFFRLSTVLPSNMSSAGRYTIAWDGKNTNGNRVSSIVYLARMEAGKFTAMKKMLLTK
jgi:hypothetical protein